MQPGNEALTSLGGHLQVPPGSSACRGFEQPAFYASMDHACRRFLTASHLHLLYQIIPGAAP